MRHVSNIPFLLCDGSRARLVRRSGERGTFETLLDVSGESVRAAAKSRLRHSPGSTVQSATAQRHGLDDEQDAHRRLAEVFAAHAGKNARDFARDNGFDRIVIVAPVRLHEALREALEPTVTVVGLLSKDLTKVPDEELGAWLSPALFSAAGV